MDHSLQTLPQTKTQAVSRMSPEEDEIETTRGELGFVFIIILVPDY